MKPLSILLFLSLVIIIYSCKKDSLNDVSYPSTFYKSGIIPLGDIRVFSNTGEISNQVLLDEFKGEDSLYFNYSANALVNYQVSYQEFMDSIIFVDKANAFVVKSFSRTKCQVKYTNTNKVFILTTSGIENGDSEDELFTRTIDYSIGEVKPEVLSEYLSSSTRGLYIFGYTSYNKYVIQKKGNQITAPVIIYITHKANMNSGGGSIRIKHVNNTLQEDFYKNIPAGDTIVVRQYQLLYEKN